MAITYAVEKAVSPEEFVDVLKRSGLAARRPLERGQTRHAQGTVRQAEQDQVGAVTAR